MKKAAGNKIKLGIFVFISIILFIGGIYFIGRKQQLFNNTFIISGIFKDINGLRVGNNVRFSGIDIGIIEDIKQTTDSTVKVDMLIDESSRKFIKKNAKAVISSDGLMGNKIVMILPGPAGKLVVSDNDILETAVPVNVDEILMNIKVTSDNAAAITGDLAAITENIREGKGTIGKLFLDTAFAKNLEQAVVNIKQGAGGFKQNMDAASHNVLLRGYLKKKSNEKEKDKK